MSNHTPGDILRAVNDVFRDAPYRNVELRGIAMLIWRIQDWPKVRSYTDIGDAFGRDRRNVVRALERITEMGVPTRLQADMVLDRLKTPT